MSVFCSIFQQIRRHFKCLLCYQKIVQLELKNPNGRLRLIQSDSESLSFSSSWSWVVDSKKAWVSLLDLFLDCPDFFLFSENKIHLLYIGRLSMPFWMNVPSMYKTIVRGTFFGPIIAAASWSFNELFGSPYTLFPLLSFCALNPKICFPLSLGSHKRSSSRILTRLLIFLITN